MLEEKDRPGYRKWLILFTLGMLFILFFDGMATAVIYPWRGFYSFGYKVMAVLLIGFYCYFVPREDKLELRLIKYFCIWLVLSRFLNGDLLLSEDGITVMDICMGCMFLPMLVIVPADKRLKLMDFICVVFCLFFTVSAVLGIYTAITGKFIVDPFTEWFVAEFKYGRMMLYQSSANISGCWMFIGIFMFVYLFMRYRNWLLRALCVLFGIVVYLGMALTFSRSAVLAFAVSTAVLAIMLILHFLKTEKNWIKALVVVLCLLIVTPLAFIPYTHVGYKLALISEKYIAAHPTEIVLETGENKEPDIEPDIEPDAVKTEDEKKKKNDEQFETVSSDTFVLDRGLSDSGRFQAYIIAFKNFGAEPMRLLRGCMEKDLMTYLNTVTHDTYGHFHNSFIQTMEYTGLPGFLLTLGFWLLLVVRAFRLFFSRDPRANLAVKSLILSLPGFFVYNMLETSAFFITDARFTLFMLISGAVIAFSYEICPPKGKII